MVLRPSPGLVGAALGASSDVGMMLSLAMPLLGTVYLISLGRAT